jgi:hypothetical protein
MVGLSHEVFKLYEFLKDEGLAPKDKPQLAVAQVVTLQTEQPKAEAVEGRPDATLEELTGLLRKIVTTQDMPAATNALAACGLSQLKEAKKENYNSIRDSFESCLKAKAA